MGTWWIAQYALVHCRLDGFQNCKGGADVGGEEGAVGGKTSKRFEWSGAFFTLYTSIMSVQCTT